MTNLTHRQLIQSGLAFAKSGGITQATEEFDDTSRGTVDLPHDWAVELPFIATPPAPGEGGKPLGRELPETSTGWCRETFGLSARDEGKRIQLEFDGNYRDATVFLNGHYLCTNFTVTAKAVTLRPPIIS